MTVLGHQLPRDAERLKRQIGYMTQKFSLYDDLTVAENLGFIAEIDGPGHCLARQRIGELLSTYALESMRNRRAGRADGSDGSAGGRGCHLHRALCRYPLGAGRHRQRPRTCGVHHPA